MPNRVAIFIDGSYLNQVLIHEHNRAKIDYSVLPSEKNLDLLHRIPLNQLQPGIPRSLIEKPVI